MHDAPQEPEPFWRTGALAQMLLQPGNRLRYKGERSGEYILELARRLRFETPHYAWDPNKGDLVEHPLPIDGFGRDYQLPASSVTQLYRIVTQCVFMGLELHGDELADLLRNIAKDEEFTISAAAWC
jgi:hypothetical protein